VRQKIADLFGPYANAANDVAQSTENQSRHASALNFGASASGSYMGVTLSSSFGYNATSDDSQALKDSRDHSVASTRQASARTRKDHKTTFRVASAAGTEDQAVRVITNPSDKESMRVDYYQMMRKWRVDLYRYGLRMTYDIVIPSPGTDLMRKIEEVAALDAQINTPFTFSLAPGQITRQNWEGLAATYQASVEPPAKEKQKFLASADVQKSHDDKDKFFVGAVEFDVDDDCEVTSGTVIVQWYYYDVGGSDPSSLSYQQWQRMLEFGEFIKFVQQAIEWENVLYFTYPYFWDTPKNWTLKQFLQHPDALHRTFLRAGSARVVLTIRPGFEDSFTQLIETGAFGQLPGDHPYVSIAKEIQNYADTHYPGIPPANPANPPDEETVTKAEQGELQATWWEYTPTSALDVQVNTALPDMA
jgi:hypothetical protein